MLDDALEIDSLTYAYTRQTRAVDDASLRVPRGSFTALLGPNGAGKTTLMSLVTRLFVAQSGRIEVCGVDLGRKPREALAAMGVVFQRPTVDLDLTVDQNLRYAAALHSLPGPLAKRRMDWAVERLDIGDRRKAVVRTLSGGLRRRVELARALLHEPSLLILDEPTVGLDIESRQAIVGYVHELCRERDLAVLWTTHLIDEVWHDDRVVVIDRGRVRIEGTIPEVLAASTTPSLAEAYRALAGGKVRERLGAAA